MSWNFEGLPIKDIMYTWKKNWMGLKRPQLFQLPYWKFEHLEIYHFLKWIQKLFSKGTIEVLVDLFLMIQVEVDEIKAYN